VTVNLTVGDINNTADLDDLMDMVGEEVRTSVRGR